jgi:transposase
MDISYVGIDLSKRKFDVALLVGEKVKNKTCPNTPAGFEELKGWLERQGVTGAHVCMEATGELYEGVATFLVNAGFTVSVVNPARIKGFAQSALVRTKNDKSDAALIARFCQAMHPTSWTPPAPEVKELQALVRRLDDLQEMHQMEYNRLEGGVSSSTVAESLRHLLEQLDQEIAKTENLIAEHIDRHPSLKEQKKLLTSIKGIADRTASVILGEIGDIFRFSSARELAAYAGLTPREHSSGTSVRGKTRLSKTGNGRLRKALYMPALVAKRWNPVIATFCERLEDRNKAKMAVVGAAMRKLLHIVFGVLKHRQRFDPAYAA